MHLEPFIVVAGLVVGFTVGLTGMGGGALMTPLLVLFFGVQPLAAVSSDLVASLFMKPVGGLVHLRRGTVNRRLVAWLCVGSVPAAFCGVLVLRSVGDAAQVQAFVKLALGVALLLAVGAMVAKAYARMRRHAQEVRSGALPGDGSVLAELRVRVVPTVLIGVVGGFIVGMTSVGSGSLIIVLLLLAYPRLQTSDLVGTDLVQAVPLVGSAALGHMLLGDVQLGLTASLVLGAIPGVYVGARVSSSASQTLVRRALAVVLLASALKLLGLPNGALGVVVVLTVVVGPLAWMGLRKLNGLPMRWRDELDVPLAVR